MLGALYCISEVARVRCARSSSTSMKLLPFMSYASNNFLIDCFGERDANPGGKTVVQFIGMAAPVAAPVVGVPRRPDADPALFCPADFNGDGAVDAADLERLLGAWGSQDGWYELSGDSLVDGADLGSLLRNWGGCD